MLLSLEGGFDRIHFSNGSIRGGMGNGFIGRYLGIILRFREPS